MGAFGFGHGRPQWRPARAGRDAGGTSPGRYSPAGTRFRLPITSQNSNVANPYQCWSQVFATGDWRASELALFFPAFFNQTNVQDHEIATTAAMEIEGISFLIEGEWRLATIMEGDAAIDPHAEGAGKWVRLSGVTLPADRRIIMRVAARYVRDGTLPRDPANVMDEAARGGTTSMAPFLTDGGTLNNANGAPWRAAAMLAKGGDGRPALVVLGDSIGCGADQYSNGAYQSPRAEFGFIGLGLDDVAGGGKRIPCMNLCVPGQNPANYAVPARVAKKLEMLEKAMALNGGAAPVDEILCQHGSMSGTVTKDVLLGYLRGTYATFRAVLGNAMPVIQVEMIAYPTSTDGYATLERQAPRSVLDAYPDGVRWQVNAAIGGPEGLGDPEAELRADGSIQGSFAPWRHGGFDTAANRDRLRLLPFETMLAADYASGNAVVLADAPAVGDYLAFGAPEDAYHYGLVSGVSGVGPFAASIIWQGGQAAKPAGTPVRATMQGGGLHPGPVAHAISPRR